MHHSAAASDWVLRFASLAPAGAKVLDLACGGGRHTRVLLEAGHRVVAVDRDTSHLQPPSAPALRVLELDLEDGRPFPFAPEQFGAVVVANYLYRPILADIVAAVAPGGVLIYETFAEGNEDLEGPSRPDFLLKPAELLDAVRGRLRVVGYEDLIVERPRRSAMQRIAAVNSDRAPLVVPGS